MPNNTGMFDWTPFYQELADKLVPYRSKQSDLIAYIESLRAKGVKVSALQDRDEAGNRFLLNEIDPFTFYGNFNRGTKTETRVAILKAIKTEFQITAPVPTDFSGIPVLNNMKAWFFSSSPYRKTGDVARLWDVFEAALHPNPLQSEEFGKAFDAALEVRNTNVNLTMGLFWIRPFTFLSLDGNNQQFLGIQIPSDGLSFSFYKETLEKVRAKHSVDFPHLSRNAWIANNEPVIAGKGDPDTPAKVNPEIGYWLVGAYWDDQEAPDQTDRFLSEGVWENGYTDKYLDQVRQMKVGDRIAIKSMFTQKHELPFDNKGKTVSGMWIKATGTIVKNVGDGRTVEVEWDQKPEQARPWYFCTYQRTIWQLKKEDPYAERLIRFVFFGEKQDFEFFMSLPDTAASLEAAKPYSVADMISEGVFLGEDEINQVLSRWRIKKNLILQGAPGVGKTFVGRKLAFALLSELDPARITTVQFHPSYSYEDFVRGYRPTDEAGKFVLLDGPMLQLCSRAKDDPDRPHVLFIDEINRANVSQVLGELMVLLEPDKRGIANSVTPLYRRNPEERFHVPENVFVIGTMNIADRSLALVDYALRRRFAFMTLEPRFGSVSFRNWLKERGMKEPLIQKIDSVMSALNDTIAKDSLLGPAYRVGHSFFCPAGTDFSQLGESWYRDVVETEIRPLLLEYWYDAPQKAHAAADALLV